MNTQIEEIIIGHFRVTPEQLRSPRSETRNIADAKHFLWYMLYRVMGYPANDIAGEYRTTRRNLFYSVAQIGDGIKTQSFYANHCRDILREMKKLELI